MAANALPAMSWISWACATRYVELASAANTSNASIALKSAADKVKVMTGTLLTDTAPPVRVKKLLGVVRRAAGRVRDLDVLQRLAVECIKEGATEQLESEVKEIRMQLKKERDTAAAELMKVLAARGIELEPMLEALIHALLPVETVGMSAVEQEVMTRSWYAAQLAEARKMSKPDEAMHHIRKAAKLARYMAEGGLAKRVVDEFRKLQEAGGRWHDCVCLRDVTLERLGKRSGLAALLKERETAARSSFEALLSD